MRVAISILMLVLIALSGQTWAIALMFIVGALVWFYEHNKKKQVERDRVLNEILKEIKSKSNSTTYNLYKIDNHEYHTDKTIR